MCEKERGWWGGESLSNWCTYQTSNINAWECAVTTSITITLYISYILYLHIFNNNYWNCITLYSHTSNIAKLSKNKLEPILCAELILLQQVLLQYLHLFLVCESGYANQIHALWTAGFRWLIPATHLQLVFVCGPTGLSPWSFFWIYSGYGVAISDYHSERIHSNTIITNFPSRDK